MLGGEGVGLVRNSAQNLASELLCEAQQDGALAEAL